MSSMKVANLAVLVGLVAGCGTAPAIPGEDLPIAADDASAKKKSAKAADDSPEGQQETSTELSSGTNGTNGTNGSDPSASPEPQPAPGDGGSANDPSAPCAADDDCAYGTICVATQCIAGCYTSADCALGQACSSGKCQTAPPTTPPPGGMPCVSDGQCNPGLDGSGQICSAQGACVPGCHLDNQCPGTTTCSNGMCR
jgi:hypothetical protein